MNIFYLNVFFFKGHDAVQNKIEMGQSEKERNSAVPKMRKLGKMSEKILGQEKKMAVKLIKIFCGQDVVPAIVWRSVG